MFYQLTVLNAVLDVVLGSKADSVWLHFCVTLSVLVYDSRTI